MADAKLQQKLGALSFLIVDDSEFDRSLMLAALKKLGVRNIQTAENGSLAMAKIQNLVAVKKCFDVILLDSKMPKLDGLALLKWIRNERSLKNQVVIVTTAHSGMEDVQDYIKLHVDGFVIKPITLEIVEAKLLELLNSIQKNVS